MEDLDQIRGRIHSIETFGTVDGPGIRFIVFLQGCPLRCQYCHNPDSWNPKEGKEVTVGEIMHEILSCKGFYTDGGVTLSGGEPLMQSTFTLALLNRCREEGLHTALDTAGSLPLSYSQKMIDTADLLLLDIKALDPLLCKELTARDNQNELSTLDYCEKTDHPIWIRHVLVPGKTLDKERLETLGAFLGPYHCIKKIDLLPFHKMGEYKWEQLGLKTPLADTPAVSKDELEEAKRCFFAAYAAHRSGQKQ